MRMDRDHIKTILPHREPMLLLTTVESLEPGDSLTATFWVDPEREIFRGHFPGDPVLPGVYTVEAMAQAADVLILTEARYRGRTPLFLGIDKVGFLRRILPGETVELRVRLASERPEKAIVTCAAEALVDGETAARGEVTLALR